LKIRNFFFLVILLLFAVSCNNSGIETTEILWDEWGVPHIYAPTYEELFYAQGWAHMESHGNLILRLYGEARGRAAEYWGGEHLEQDRFIHTMNVPKRAAEWYEQKNETYRSYLDAFVEGINTYAEQHPEKLSNDIKMVLPVEATDILAHVQRAFHLSFIIPPGTLPRARQHLAAASNAWAIAPERTTTGNAMLLSDPHLPWDESLFRFYELHLITPDVELYGATLVGLPGIILGFNSDLAWTHTVNTHDGTDIFELTLEENGYEFEGEVRRFEERTETINVRDNDGDLRDETVTILESVHGPVIAQDDDKAIAIRVVGFDSPGMFEQWWRMGTARNLEQFEDALRMMKIPMLTVMYVDRAGNIMHLFNGHVPIRSGGNWNEWRQILPGNTSENIWVDIHPYEDLPRVVDPPTGWLQNANDPPWTTTIPYEIDPGDYPPYMAPHYMDLRAQQSARLLKENDSLTFEEMVELKHTTYIEATGRMFDDLFDAIEEYGDESAVRAGEVLRNWDRTTGAESRGAVLFVQWAMQFQLWNNFEVFWDPDEPLETPRGLQNHQRAVEVLSQVARDIESRYGSLDVRWGDVYRVRIGEYDFPAQGGPGHLGIFHVLGFDRDPDDENRYIASFGESFIAAVEFSDPVQAKVLTAYGNATQPHLPHRGDQLELFANRQLRDAFLTRESIERSVVNRTDFE